MRVAMVSEHASPLATLGGVDAGGQNVHVAALSQALARRSVEVTVHTRRDDADLPRRVRMGTRRTGHVLVDHVSAGPQRPLPKDALLPHMEAMADDLRGQWRADRPDIVHAHFWMSGIAAVSAARDLGIPVVQTFHALGVVKRRHQGQKDTSPPERLDLERRLVRDVDRVVATCSDEVFELVRMGADTHRVSVVPCGVDVDLFTPDGPREPRGDRARVLFVGRLVERKGLGNTIAALAQVPDAELVVAGGPPSSALGDDPEVARLRAVAERYGVSDRVVFRGRVDRQHLPALLRSADVVSCVPWYEPFGIVPLEAMACGVPVVASAVGGLADTVVHGSTGLHVPPRDPDAVARAINDLLADPARRAALAAQGVERVRRRYTWDRIAEGTLQAYGHVLASPQAEVSVSHPLRGVDARVDSMRAPS